MTAVEVLDRLRGATADVHRGLDGAVDPVRRLHALADRAHLLGGYYRMHAGAEAAMEPLLCAVAAVDFSGRRRAPVIAACLRELGCEPPDAIAAAPRAETPAAALGLLYVMEGSTLGGRIILRQLHANGADPTGLGFLDPYGARTGSMWRALLGVLQEELGTDADALLQAVHGARLGFAHASACLAETRTAGRLESVA